MKKNWKVFIILGIVLVLLAGSAFLSALSDFVPSNSVEVTGNTAGNLNNGGLFAEADGEVFFSNAFDHGALYSMNVDETNIKKLNSSKTCSINVGGNYVYYYMDSSEGGTGMGYVVRTFGVYRSKRNGHSTKCLDRSAAVTMLLTGDYIYYQHYNNTDFTQLYKIKTNKTDKTIISESVINPVACHNGIIYFNGTDKDHYLYALDTRTDTISTVFQGNLWYPVYHNDYIYYMDVSSNYRLCRYNLSSNTIEILTNDRVDCFNVGDFFIYYQRNSASDPALMRMGLDGSSPEVVAPGIYENINLTSQYAYFNAFGQTQPIYHTPVMGPVNVSVFSVAEDVASK